MIITLKGADFSASNIGTLSSWRITRSLGSGATYEGATSVDKGAAFSATVTLAEGYEIGTAGVTITMGGIVLSGAHSISGNVITITIASVTGNVLIKVPTINTAGGEEEPDIPVEPDEPTEPTLTLDSVAYENLTYRQIFVNNNIAPNINNNSKKPVNSSSFTYTDKAGTTTIVSSDVSENNFVPPYSLHVSGTTSQQAMCNVNNYGKVFLASNVKVTRYSKGYCGLIVGSTYSGAVNKVTDGYEVKVGTASITSSNSLFIGSASSANLEGYINNPVVVNTSIFTTEPSVDEFTALYNNYTAMLIAGQK